MIRTNDLRGIITNAFSSVPHPGPGNITQHDCEECNELMDIFGPLRWESVPPEIVDANFGQLPLFAPEAYRYFLPAYLLRCLDNFDPDNPVCEFLIYSLTDCSEESAALRSERVELFNAQQRAAVAAFLELVTDSEPFEYFHSDAAEALTRVWKPRLEDTT